MAKSVTLKEADTFIDTEGIRDFEQGKTQAEINASLVQADNLKNGYFVLPGGLKMCWGTAQFTEDEKAITFPITFDSVPKVFTNCQTSQTYEGKHIITSSAMLETTSGFTATKRYYSTETNSYGNAGEPLDWFAIGY